MRWKEVEPHCVHLQCTCQMLCSFIADVVVVKIQRCECLCEMKIGDMWFSALEWLLFYELRRGSQGEHFRKNGTKKEDLVWSKSEIIH